MWQQIKSDINTGSLHALARGISLIENEVTGYEEMLESLPSSAIPVIGITGPPGAGKSTLTDALISLFIKRQKKVAILCIDPSSPFHMGALLGDRIRMNQWYNNPNVFIRSLATRGSLGGLNPKVIEITDLLKFAGFDVVIIETVGVGQSETEIAGLADATVVVMVPEAGDEIQTMKSGLMEIADIFVVNKADRPGADAFVNNLQQMLSPAFSNHTAEIPVLKTIAGKSEGIAELLAAIDLVLLRQSHPEKKYRLLAERAWHLIKEKKMKETKKEQLKELIAREGKAFNLYRFVKKY